MPDDPTDRVRVTPGGADDIQIRLNDEQLRTLRGQMIPGTVTCGKCKRQHQVLYTLLGGDVAVDCECGAAIRLTLTGELKKAPPSQK